MPTNPTYQTDGYRFKPGNPGGGRKPRATEQEYLTATISTCTIDRWVKIVEKAVQQAEQGDHKAREWLGSYLMPTIKALAAQAASWPAENEAAEVAERLEQLNGEDLAQWKALHAKLDGGIPPH